jgi:hypothetical protein
MARLIKPVSTGTKDLALATIGRAPLVKALDNTFLAKRLFNSLILASMPVKP